MNDKIARRNFDRATKTADLKLKKLGPWRWSAAGPRPPWHTLAKARVWTAADMAAVRLAVGQRPLTYETAESAEGVVTLDPTWRPQ